MFGLVNVQYVLQAEVTDRKVLSVQPLTWIIHKFWWNLTDYLQCWLTVRNLEMRSPMPPSPARKNVLSHHRVDGPLINYFFFFFQKVYVRPWYIQYCTHLRINPILCLTQKLVIDSPHNWCKNCAKLVIIPLNEKKQFSCGSWHWSSHTVMIIFQPRHSLAVGIIYNNDSSKANTLINLSKKKQEAAISLQDNLLNIYTELILPTT